MDDGNDDAALVRGVRRGERACFDMLVRRHQRAARAVARAVCGAMESQDVAQEAFVRAWTNLDLLADPARFGPWLRRITFACAIDWLRARPARSAPLEDAPSGETTAEAQLADHELAAAVRAAVARLPPRYRRPLALYHLDGLRQDRIAAALGVAPGTVRSLVTRARQSLRAQLAAFAPEAAMKVDPAEDLLGEPKERRLLHVCNGHATSRPLAEAGVPGDFKLSVDVLLEGPCPLVWDDEWRKLRQQVLAGLGGGGDGPGVAELWDEDVARALASDLDEIVLWYEHDLYDQLLLIRLLALIARHEGRRPPVSLVCIGAHPDVPNFMGLGQLGPAQLASLFETRAPVDEATVALGRDAWAAYADPDPRRRETFVARDLSPLPFLARALRRHLDEFPGVSDGLSRSERTLLSLVQDGVTDVADAWRRLHAAEDCHYLADSWYVRVIERLAPLLTVEGDLRLPLARGQATLSLTALGADVLRGRADWLAHAEDRWLGGAHLTGARTWRWDPVAGCLREP